MIDCYDYPLTNTNQILLQSKGFWITVLVRFATIHWAKLDNIPNYNIWALINKSKLENKDRPKAQLSRQMWNSIEPQNDKVSSSIPRY